MLRTEICEKEYDYKYLGVWRDGIGWKKCLFEKAGLFCKVVLCLAAVFLVRKGREGKGRGC